jgi:hypothetical protein
MRKDIKSYTKEIALVGVLTALNAAVDLYVPLLAFYVFVILALVLKPWQSQFLLALDISCRAAHTGEAG